MNIRRFTAENSRSALRQVRETLGGDAIILANRSIEGGVEVLAAAPEEVDALTRRMSPPIAPGASAASAAYAMQPAIAAAMPDASYTTQTYTPATIGDLRPAPSSSARGRFASLFARRTTATQPAAAATPIATAAIVPTAAPLPVATPLAAANAYADDFASELAAATSADDDFVARLAPEAVALSRPRPANAQPAPVVEIEPAKPAPAVDLLLETLADEPVAAPIVVAPAAAASQAAPVPTFSATELSDTVTRDVSREVTREVTRDVTREIRAMQESLTEQLATLSWTDAMRRQPGRTKLMQDLILAGFSPSLARHIQGRLPDDFSNDEAREWAQAILRRNLPVATDAEELINEGGVFALVGPTGVGKTTTVAKLAARFAMKHGVEQLALITTDGFRIGAQDQLRIYGKILGVPVHSIHDQASLSSAITHLADKKLVLIDTAGLGQRDERVAEQIAMLRGAKAKRLVVLNATVDGETLDHVVSTFADRDFAGCVITKTDEAARLGPVLDAVIRHRLKIHHVSTGQKVPEDLERPDVKSLVQRALCRPMVRAAFDLSLDDEPVWMSAMAERARPLDPALFAGESGHV